jgi:hypothetical protein
MSGKLVEHLGMQQDSNETTTANSMRAYKSTYNACLDLFFHGAAYREKSEKDIIDLFSKAYKEDKDMSLRILAYFRDVREGSGERKFFRTCIKWIASVEEVVPFNISYIPTIGRWDDLLSLVDASQYCTDYVLQEIATQLVQDKPDSLCAKWMPRKGRIARLIREHMGIYPKDYRKIIVKHTKVVESQMCNKQWESIRYESVPSVANVKYNKAFLRNDETRRRAFLEAAKKGEVKINASVAFPHTIVSMLLERSTNSVKEGETLERILRKDDTAIAMWKNLPNVIGDGNKRILFCSDTSGSMAGDPLKISLAMGIYCSERLSGPFKNAFITFSKNPVLQYTEGNIYERLCQVRAFHPSNTNFQGIFQLVLDTAQKYNLPEEEMPTDICICSDMDFDQATGRPNDDAFTLIRKMYAESGYDMPNIIFWNVNARNSHFPVQRNSRGVALISGASQNAIKSVISGVTTPVECMINTVNTERYQAFIESDKNVRA